MGEREQFDDARLERLQLRLTRLEKVIAACPFIEGVKSGALAIAITPTTVEHRLGRTPSGCIILRATADAAIGFSTTQPSDTTKFVNLEASVAATFVLWFW